MSVKVYSTSTEDAKHDRAILHQYQCALLLGTARKMRTQQCPKCAKKYAHKDHKC